MSRLRFTAATLALAVAPALALGVPALAKDGFFEQVSNDDALLAPGTSITRTVLVTNRSNHEAELHLRATGIEDDDHGCVRPESRDGDDSCGGGGGELGDWLELTVVDTSGAQLWSGGLDELGEGATLLPQMSRRSDEELRIVTTMSLDAGNDTMTDAVSYDLEWTISALHKSSVTTTRVTNAAGGTGAGVSLSASAVQALQSPRTYAVALGLFALMLVPGRLRRHRHEGRLDGS